MQLKLRADAARTRMAVKDGHVRRLRKLRAEELARKKKDAVFRANTLKERRERIRRQQEYGRRSLALKLQVRAARQKKVKALERAVAADRRNQYKQQLIAKHKLDAEYGGSNLERNQMPGPGAYVIPSTLNLNAGRKIGKSSAASYIEVECARSAAIPGPSAYGEADYRPNPTVVKFSTAFVPSELDWAIARARELPAPDAYQSKVSQGMGGSTSSFSMGQSKVKTDVDWVMHRSASMPGPHDYFEGLPETKLTPLRKLAREVGVAGSGGAAGDGQAAAASIKM